MRSDTRPSALDSDARICVKSGKGLTAYVGLDPQLHQSGRIVQRQAAISRQGDPTLHQLLFVGALGGIRSRTSALRLFYDRLLAVGKQDDSLGGCRVQNLGVGVERLSGSRPFRLATCKPVPKPLPDLTHMNLRKNPN